MAHMTPRLGSLVTAVGLGSGSWLGAQVRFGVAGYAFKVLRFTV